MPPLEPNWRTPSDLPPRPLSRGWWVAGAALLLAGVVAAVTWVVLWLAPPAGPRVVALAASYEDNLLLPPNAAGAKAADEICKEGRGGRGRLKVDPVPTRFTRGDAARVLNGVADLREPAVVLLFAAHGGCDSAGPFLIPDDAGADPAERVRVTAVLDAVAKLPARTRKLIVFDATSYTAAPAFGQFANDFARGVESLDSKISAVPNLTVFVSSGNNERSWVAPEWGTTAFMHFVHTGLKGAADANRDGRLNGAELADFVTARTHDWSRDHRGAAQTPRLFPTHDGHARAADFPLGLVDAPPPPDPLPEAFTPPTEWERAWAAHAELTGAVEYAPQLWHEFTTRLLRADEHFSHGLSDAALAELAKADKLADRLRAARVLGVPNQTFTLSSAVGDSSAPDVAAARPLVEKLALASAVERADVWAKNRPATEPARLAVGIALVEWVADDPAVRLKRDGPLASLISEGVAVPPAELHFLAMLAKDLPPQPVNSSLWPVVRRVLRLRLVAERVANGPLASTTARWSVAEYLTADTARRHAEDLLFGVATDWQQADRDAGRAEAAFNSAEGTAVRIRSTWAAARTTPDTLRGLGEWLTTREELLPPARTVWDETHALEPLLTLNDLDKRTDSVVSLREKLTVAHRDAVRQLLAAKPGESRGELVRWQTAADAVGSVPFDADRRAFLTERRRVSRQLAVLARTRPEALPDVSADATREIAFDHARRLALLHLAQLGKSGPEIDRLGERFDAPGELLAASDELARLFRDLPGEIDSARQDNIATADRLSRLSILPIDPDPADAHRRQHVKTWLNSQANRTAADQWSGGANAKPYYRVAADQLRESARAIGGGVVPVLTPDAPFPLAASTTTPRVLTDEPAAVLNFTLSQPANAAKSGYVAYTVGDTRTVRGLVDPPAEVRYTLPPRTAPLPPKPTVEPVPVTLAGYFRGRTSDLVPAVVRHPLPHVASAVRPTGESASIAVRISAAVRAKYGSGSGAVHLVLDCSGSLKGERFAASCDVLENLLAELPPGVAVAVSTFGQKGGKSPEESFAPLLPLTTWPADAKGEAAKVAALARALEPWDHSAIARSAIRAKDALAKVEGPRAVVLITDAIDTRFVNDPANPKKQSVKDGLRAAFGSDDPTLHVIAFAPASKDDAAARDEFGITKELPNPGLLVTPDKYADVLKALRSAFAPRVRFSISGADGKSRDLISGSPDADNWLSGPLLTPGKRTVRASVGGGAEIAVNLRAADRLLLELIEDGDKLRFVRPNAAAYVPAVARKSAGPWTVAARTQRLLDGGGLEVIALADRGDDSPTAPARAGELLFDVQPANVAVRLTAEPGWPSAALKLGVRHWPTEKPTPPTLKAWWSGDQPFPSAARWEPLGLVTTDKPVTLKLADGAAEIESVATEEHEVEVRAGVWEKRSVLAVRTKYPPGKPWLPRLVGPAPAGSEVRVFADANKTTGLFWWADSADAKKVTAVEFVSVPAARADAEAAGRSVTLPQLPVPFADKPLAPPAPLEPARQDAR